MKIFAFKLLFAISAWMLFGVSKAQIIIPTGTVLSVNANTKVTLLTPYNIVNNSNFDFSSAKVTLKFNGATQSITGNLFVAELLLNGDGTKNINGNVTVTNKIQLDNGVLIPSATGKLLFTGPENGISGGNSNSYCDGIFYSTGNGKRFFPVGKSGVFIPAQFENVTGEVGVTLHTGSALLSYDTAEISSIDISHYWEIKTDPTKINSQATLSLTGANEFVKLPGNTIVVQADNVGSRGQNLGSAAADNNTIVSRKSVSSSILAIGKDKKVTVRIHDLITPYGSEATPKNDKLYIESIEKFDHNKVTLLDRWGTRVAEWINFTNAVNYDFSKLSAGNYICVVEYGNAEKTSEVKQQMVTVLKTY